MSKAKKNVLQGIEIREWDSGTTYRVRINYQKKTYRATFDTFEEAIHWRDSSKKKLKAGIPIDGSAPDGDMQLGKATAKFILGVTHSRSKASINSYNWAEAQLIKYFGEKILLSAITQSKMYEYVSHRQNVDRVGPSKISQELSFTRMVYEAARAWDISIPSPERNIPRPKKKKLSREDKLERVIKAPEMIALFEKVKVGHPHKYITPEKYQEKFGVRNTTLQLYLIFLLYTGMRPSEAASLRWKPGPAKSKGHNGYIDMDRGGFSKVGTKTETRFVPAHPVTRAIIKNIDQEGTFVFVPDEHGQRQTPYKFYRSAFETARANTIIDDQNIRQNIDFYSFRHTARSRMAVCGVQDSAAEIILGHDGNEMQQTYTHYEDADLVREIAKVDYPWLDLSWLK